MRRTVVHLVTTSTNYLFATFAAFFAAGFGVTTAFTGADFTGATLFAAGFVSSVPAGAAVLFFAAGFAPFFAAGFSGERAF